MTDIKTSKKKFLPSDLPLNPIPNILTELGQQKQPHQRLVGFAAQTRDIITPAQEKLKRKQLNAIVTNPIDQLHTGLVNYRWRINC